MKTDNKVHLYLRDTKGRIVTHFLLDKNKWDAIIEVSKIRNMTAEQWIIAAIENYARDKIDEYEKSHKDS